MTLHDESASITKPAANAVTLRVRTLRGARGRISAMSPSYGGRSRKPGKITIENLPVL